MRATAVNPNKTPATRYRSVVVYQVYKDSEMVAEFADLPSARTKAVEVVGRIQVANKQIEIK